MTSHPAPDALRRYAAGLVDGEALLEVDAHVTSCGQCRQALWTLSRGAFVPAATADAHLTFEVMRAVVDGRASANEASAVARHAAACAACAVELADLRAFAAELGALQNEPQPTPAGAGGTPPRAAHERLPRRSTAGGWAWLGSAGLATAATVALLLRVTDTVPPSGGAARPPAVAPVPAPVPTPSTPPAGSAASGIPPAPALRAPQADVRRGTSRVVAGRTFRLEDGIWVDQAFDPLALQPDVWARSAEDVAALVASTPGLAPYAAMASRVTVVLDDTVYHLGQTRR